MISSCGNSKVSDDDILYTCDEFTIYSDSVVSGSFTAVAPNSFEIHSNYSASYPHRHRGLVKFRLSLNGRDNELPVGQSHLVDFSGGIDNRTHIFGHPDTIPHTEAIDSFSIADNTPWIVRVDMRPVLRALADNGFFVTATGDTIFSKHFRGLWITGNIPPLGKEIFSPDHPKALKLFDRGDSIYEIALTLSPSKLKHFAPPSPSIASKLPRLTTRHNLINAIYNMGVDKISVTYTTDNHNLSTSDIVLATSLSLAISDPDMAKKLLMSCVDNGVVRPDITAYPSWPVTSCRSAWAIAAYEVYKSTADTAWMKQAYRIASRTFHEDKDIFLDSLTNLFKGGISQEYRSGQLYPTWMKPIDIYESMSLTNNILAAEACKALSRMATDIGLAPESAQFSSFNRLFSESVNSRLWIPNRGIYSKYLYGAPYAVQAQSTDNIGQALAMIFGIATPEMSASILSRTPSSTFGIPAIYPQLPDTVYLAGMPSQPYIQVLWSIAAARNGHIQSLENEIAALIRNVALNASTDEITMTTNGMPAGTSASDHPLRNPASVMAIPLRMLAGIHLSADGMEFHPCIPPSLNSEINISGIKYRNAIFDITISGSGNRIAGFYIDKKIVTSHFLPPTLTGRHSIKIIMANNSFRDRQFPSEKLSWLPSTPNIKWTSPRRAQIPDFSPGKKYLVTINGVIQEEITRADYTLFDTDQFTTVAFEPIASKQLVGYISEPYHHIPDGTYALLPATTFASARSSMIRTDDAIYQRFVELSPSRNTRFRANVNVAKEGYYYIDVKYANGTAPWWNQSKCAMRSLIVNGHRVGSLILPTLASDDWSTTAWSNRLRIYLNKGINTISIEYRMPVDHNFDAKDNTALIEYIRFIKI